MPYKPTVWVKGNAPAITDYNLNNMERGIYNAHAVFEAGGTATAITLSIDGVTEYQPLGKLTFIASADNNAAATTVNINGLDAKPLYKPNTTAAPNLKAGKPYTIVLEGNKSSFFLQASAEGDAVAGEVLAGKKFSNDDDTGITGTMPNRGSVGTVNLTNEGQEYTIQAGYHNGAGKVKAMISGLIANVIKAGTTVGGILGTFTSDATAAASQMLDGVTAYVNGVKVTGTIPSKTAQTYVPGPTSQKILSGFYLSGDQTIAGDADLVSTNIRAGVNIFGVAGNSQVVNTSSGTAAASHILSGYKAWVDGSELTGTMTNRGGASTITPSTSTQYRYSGYYSGTQTILGDGDLVAGNIKSGVNIFGVTGNYLGNLVLKGVQSGTSDSVYVEGYTTITAVDPSKTVVFGSNKTQSNTVGDWPIIGFHLASGTRLNFITSQVPGAWPASWFIVEYLSGVSVQRGVTSQSSSSTDISISSVNMSRSYIVLETVGLGTDSLMYPRVYFLNSTTIRVDAYATDTTNNKFVWQVVTYL